MSYVVLASNGKYYTGRAGEGWLGEKAEAFTYSKEGAEWKAGLFNKLFYIGPKREGLVSFMAVEKEKA